MQRSIKIRVLKENTSKVTIHLVSANRKMVVPKEKFLQHVKSGLYDIVNVFRSIGLVKKIQYYTKKPVF